MFHYAKAWGMEDIQFYKIHDYIIIVFEVRMRGKHKAIAHSFSFSILLLPFCHIPPMSAR
jgi:hypothetical protein